jgi:DNA-binding LytR/AlgR family response regulator
MNLDHPANTEVLSDIKQGGTWSMVPFHDEKGILRFSVKRDDLLYLEAADNYVLIHYLDGDKQLKYMIRTTLKRIEEEFSEKNLVRCHRSYMINIDHVKTIRKEKEGLIINFESPVNITIPISKTYLDIFIRKLSNTVDPDEFNK